MNRIRVFITSMGIVSALGRGKEQTIEGIRLAAPVLRPLRLFPSAHEPALPVGEITFLPRNTDLPRTHVVSLIAAEEAMKNSSRAPDAIVIGTTTGGITDTEERLKAGDKDAQHYANHSAGSVSECVARRVGCSGPVLTVSTACSSGTIALKIALEMLRSGKAVRVLAGGADALCRLTYYGFNSLQLVDPTGAHPFDLNRCGMAVGEGSALFLLTAAEEPPSGTWAELMGIGLSCDAYHPASPHPQGTGALAAIRAAAAEAEVSPEQIGFIHYHGTGTLENDLVEAKAVTDFFGSHPLPPGASTKGLYGHALAAAGAIGAAVAVFSIRPGMMPANVGLRDRDPVLRLSLLETPVALPAGPPIKKPMIALANAFGFGGNNAALIVGDPKRQTKTGVEKEAVEPVSFEVLGRACLSGAGALDSLLKKLAGHETARGLVSAGELTKHLSERYARRMKRLTRLTLSLAISAVGSHPEPPASVYFGTGWGALSETHDFLERLFETNEQFASPIDFIGSVHNSAAGHTAIHFKATGPNITTTGDACSFEQALMSAGMVVPGAADASDGSNHPLLIIGADEYHPTLTPLFDPSSALCETPADGGGALLLRAALPSSSCRIRTTYLAYVGDGEPDTQGLIRSLGGTKSIRERFGVILAGLPAASHTARNQLTSFLTETAFPKPVIEYRRLIGEFASASAVAAVLAVSFVQRDEFPGKGATPESLHGCGALVLGFGHYITAMEITPW